MPRVLLTTAISLLFAGVFASSAATRPNILFIVADDLRADAIHALGNQYITTPNLDKLVKRGSVFEQVYTMGSTVKSVGVSTRAVMLSGRSLFRFSGDLTEPTEDMPLLPEVLRKRGYATFATGKWPNGKNWFKRSFSHGDKIFFGVTGNHKALEVYGYDSTGEYPEESKKQIEEFSSTTFANATTEFLENRPRGIPFFAYVSFTAPRSPHNPPSGYQIERPPVPDNFDKQHPFDNGALSSPEEKHLVVPRIATEIQDELAEYYAMITHLDEQIGSIIHALDLGGMLENTVIVITSDNGLSIGSHGLLGKQNLYEHSLRVPLILAGPGIPRDEQYIDLCYQMDIYPTICEITGIGVPESVEGKSLLPIINAEVGGVRKTLFAAYADTQRAVRDHRYKMIYYPEIEKYQVFNLRNDPYEMNDLFHSGKHGRDINRLRIQLAAWQSSLNDPLR